MNGSPRRWRPTPSGSGLVRSDQRGRPLLAWFWAVYLIATQSNGISVPEQKPVFHRSSIGFGLKDVRAPQVLT
jgi:hypothetical protein